jgi:Na+/proline symporter
MIETARDVMIIISAFLVIAGAITFTVITIMVYRKVGPTLDAAQGFFTDLRSVSAFFTGRVMGPAVRGAAFAAGLRKAISTISKRAHSTGKGNGDGKRD